MGDGFAVGEGAAVADQRAWLVGDRAQLAAGGAGVVGGEGLGLLLQEGGEGALGQAAGGGGGDLFQGEQIDVQAGAGVTEGAAGDDLAPLGRQITDILEFFGCESRSGHGLSCLGVTPSDVEGLSCPFYRKVLHPAKPVLASPARRADIHS